MPSTQSYPTANAPTGRLAEIRRVLEAAFNGDFTDDDWGHACGGTHVTVLDLGRVVAHASVVPRTIVIGDRSFDAGYVEGVGTDPVYQGTGLGSLAMASIASTLVHDYALGVLSTSAHGFYERLGWERWQGPTYVRHGADRVRTEDEDDGIMVLRFGPSAAIDLKQPIMCAARTGDDW